MPGGEWAKKLFPKAHNQFIVGNFFLTGLYSLVQGKWLTVTTTNKNRKNLHRNASSIMKIEKVDKHTSFPILKSGLLYTPTEFVEYLIENFDS